MSPADHYRRLLCGTRDSSDDSDRSRLQVIAPATVEPISLAMARKQCRVDVDPTLVPPSNPDDDLIQLYLTAAREWAELQLGMVVSPTTVEMAMDAFPSGDIVLESWPVLGVTTITYTDPLTSMSAEVGPMTYRLDARDYPARLRLSPGETWPDAVRGADEIAVRYELGYSAAGDSPQQAPLPARIKVAILLVLSHFYEHRSEQTELVLQTLPIGARSMLAGLSVRSGFA